MKLIVDFNPNGHHCDYVEKMIRCGFDGTLLTSQYLWNEISSRLKENCKVAVHIPVKNMPLGNEELNIILNFMKQNEEVSECLHLHFDYLLNKNKLFFLKKALLFRKIPNIGGIWFGNNYFYPRKYYITDWIKYSLVFSFILIILLRFRNIKIYFMNEDIARCFKKIYLIKNQVEWCPDPFNRRSTVIKAKYKVKDSVIPTILFVGYHLPHKGTTWALRALLKWNTPLRIIIGGSIEKCPEIKILCEKYSLPVQITLKDWRLSENELCNLYSIASVVVLPYIHYGGSSGILVDAIYNNVPVLVSDWGIIGKRVKRLTAGRTFSVGNELDFRNKLKDMLNSKKFNFNNPDIKKYLRQNSPEKFYEALTGNIPIKRVDSNKIMKT